MALLSAILATYLVGTSVTQPVRPRFVILAIGVKNYNYDKTGFRPLNGPRDVAHFMGAMEKFFGVSQAKGDDITLRTTDAQTTRASIAAAFEHVVQTAKKGDAVVIFYSGHGTQVPDASKATGLSQAIVPIDIKRKGNKSSGIVRDSVIAGPEIGGYLKRLGFEKKVDNITMFFDSCHSENITRGCLVAKAGIANGDNPAKPIHGASKDEGWDLQGTLAVFSAAEAKRAAYEDLNLKQGVFTASIVKAMERMSRRQASDVPYGSFFDDVKATTRAHAYAIQQEQVPRFEGDRERTIFGTNAIPLPAYFSTFVEGNTWRVEAGEVHGIKAGFIFGLYPTSDDTMKGPPQHLGVATRDIRTTSVGIRFVDQQGNPAEQPEASARLRAILIDGQPSGKIRVRIDGDSSADWVKAYAANPVVELVNEGFDMRITSPSVAKGGSSAPTDWIIRDDKENVITTLIGEAGSVDFLKNLKNLTIKRAKRKSVSELAPGGTPSVHVAMELVPLKTTGRKGSERVTWMGHKGEQSLEVRGQPNTDTSTEYDQRFAIRVKAESPLPGAEAPFITILDLTANGKITNLFPARKHGQSFSGGPTQAFRLPVNGKWYYVGDLRFVDGSDLTQVTSFEVNPKDDGEGLETLKMIATDTYLEFDPLLVQEGTKAVTRGSTENTALVRLMDSYGTGTPLGFATRGDNGRLSNWSVCSAQLIVLPKK